VTQFQKKKVKNQLKLACLKTSKIPVWGFQRKFV
jgi:hypothetical protein